MAACARRNRRAALRGADEIARLHHDADEMVRSVTTELTALLGLRNCWFEPVPAPRPLPRLERTGAVTGTAEHRYVSGDFTCRRSVRKLVSQRRLLDEVRGPMHERDTNHLRVLMAQVRRKLEPEPSRPATSSLSPRWATASRRRPRSRRP